MKDATSQSGQGDGTEWEQSCHRILVAEGLLLPGEATVVREGAPEGEVFETDLEEHVGLSQTKKGGEIISSRSDNMQT